MKIKSILQKFKHLFILAAILLCAVVCMAWVGYDTVRDSVGLGHRQIVNDEYSVLSGDISNGIVQPITVKANRNFYGVNINLHTYNRVVFGKIFVELWDTDGNVLAVAQDDMTNIKDNTFMRFIFDQQNFKSDEDKEYQLVIYTRPETPEDKVAVWQSAETVEGYKPMTFAGEETEGTLALQYIVKYVTSAIRGYYLILCGLMLLLLAGAYLLIFVARVKISTAFVFIAAVTGIIFSLYTPVRGAADEFTHITSSYANSNTLFGMENNGYYEGHLLMRECDADDYINPVNYNAFEVHKFYESLVNGAEGKTELVYVRTWIAKVFPPLYWAQTAGVHLARIMGVGFSGLIVMGRLFNLAMYIGLVWLAIRRMPVYKTTMAAIALTPIPLQLAASFNYDTLVTALCFLFTATVFDLAYSKEKVSRRDVVILAVLAAFIAPSKTIYILLVGICLIIPFEKFGGTKKALINLAVIAAAAVVMWLAYNQNFIRIVKNSIMPSQPAVQTEAETQQPELVTEEESNPTEFNGIKIADVETIHGDTDERELDIVEGDDILSNGDSINYYTIGYIFSHIPQTVKLVVNTVQENTELYIRQIFGGILGEVIVSPVKINWLYVLAVIAIVYMTTILPQGEKLQYRGVRKWWCFAVAMAVAALVVAAGVMWTPVNYTTIFGIQGRYMIPVLPLAVMLFANDGMHFKKKIDGALIFALCAVNVLILLDGLTIMLANTTVYY